MAVEKQQILESSILNVAWETPKTYSSRILTPEGFVNFETVYIPRPEHPKKIKIGGFEVWEYLTPEQVTTHIQRLANLLNNFNSYENVVNMNGGSYLQSRLAQINDNQKPASLIEIHRILGGFGSDVKRSPAKRLIGKRVKIIDDIKDSGHTGRKAMSYFDPHSIPVYLMTKFGIEAQVYLPNEVIAFLIDKVWVGGCGMDLGLKGEGNLFRNYGGLVMHPNLEFSL